MRQIHGQEVHWYLILNQFFFEIYNILVLGILNIRSQEDTQTILAVNKNPPLAQH